MQNIWKGDRYTWTKSKQQASLAAILDTIYGTSKLSPPSTYLPEKWYHEFTDTIYLIRHHIDANNKIIVIGDYDVDGISGSVLMHHFLTSQNATFHIHIPNRFTEGYGLNLIFLESIKDKYDLLITIDNGTSAIKEITFISDYMDVIIMDHHAMGQSLPPTNNIVNFVNHKNKNLSSLCATGVVFMFINAWNIIIPIQKMNVNKYIDLVALATVCDVMNMTPLNRIFVLRGINDIQNSSWGRLLIGNSDSEINVHTFGFQIGPYINACGRMGDAHSAFEFLIGNHSMITKLFHYNRERKVYEKSVLTSLKKQCDTQGIYPIVCIIQDDIHEGVIGILASRIKEYSHKPTFIFTKSIDDNSYKASARSTKSLHVGNLINDNLDLLISGGGHGMAGGLTISKNNLNKFIDILQQQNVQEQAPRTFVGFISPWAINKNLWTLIVSKRPFTSNRITPIFCLRRCYINFVKYINEKHGLFSIRFLSHTKSSIVFNIKESWMVKYIYCKDIVCDIMVQLGIYKNNITISIIDVCL